MCESSGEWVMVGDMFLASESIAVEPNKFVVEVRPKSTAEHAASRRIVSQLLQRHGDRQRKAVKKVAMGSRPDRNAQFENITRLKSEYQAAGPPVVSTDTKKKELLGNFHRDGVIETQEPIAVNDHDFGSHGLGKVVVALRAA